MQRRLKRLLASLASYYGSLRYLRDGRIALLSGANLLNVMSVSIIVPLLPTYADRLGAGPVLIGLLFTLPTAARALCSTPFGYLADRTARKPLIVLGTCLGATSVVGLGLAENLEALLALRALDGIASAMQTPATTAYLGDVTDEDTRGSVMGAYRTVGMVGVALGPAAGGALAGVFSPAVPFVVLGSLTLGGGLLLGVRLPAIGNEHESQEKTDWEGIGFSLATVSESVGSTVVALSVWALVSAVGTRALDPLLAPLLSTTVGGEPSYVGFAWAAFGLTMAVCMPVGGTLADRVSRKWALVTSDLLWALVLFGLALSTIRVVPPLLLAVGGVASALGAPALTALQYESAPKGNEGALLGFYSTVYSIGGTAGPLLGGAVAATVGVRVTVILIGASWLLAAFVITVGVRNRTTERTTSNPADG